VSAILLRHASAGARDAWVGDDRLRPLDGKGRRQARKLAPQLARIGARRVVSSPYTRCLQTVAPLAEALGVEVEADERLAEGADDAALPLLAEDGVVACTHGDVASALLGRPLAKAAAAVVERDADGRPLVTALLRP
jgi:phosphohistidine phosphatase SixA